MLHTVTRIGQWASIPVLLVTSIFWRCAASYEPVVDLLICAGAIILVLRAVWLKEYYWASGLAAIGVGFSPVGLASKIFLLMGIGCVTLVAASVATLRTQPVEAL